MLSIPTADDLMGDNKYTKNHPVETWSSKKRGAYNRQMKGIQLQMIRLRHLDTMDAETKARALMVLDGTYRGKAITLGRLT